MDSPGIGGGAALLFSLQLFVDRLSLLPAGGAPDIGARGELLVGFQLLQHEIVVFERRQTTDGSEMVLEHGRSCLFEAEPAALAAQLREESDAPLVLLLMAQECDRALLVAFASVALPLHAGLLSQDDLPTEMKYRVCEWARGSGDWELRNRQGDNVGKVTGAVTLSCLGKSLAPHLANALGVHVGCAPSKSPISKPQTPTTFGMDLDRINSVGKQQEEGMCEASAAREGRPMEDSPKCSTSVADAAIQCEVVAVTSDSASQQRKQRNPGAICLSGAGQHQRGSMRALPRHPGSDADRERDRCSSTKRGAYNEGSPRSAYLHEPLASGIPARVGGMFSSRSLPPPLFFQKQPAGRKR